MRLRTGPWICALAALSMVGCTSDRVMQELTSTRISAATGGVAKSHDGVLELSFAPGALAEDTDVRIETLHTLTDPELVGSTYELGPDGLTFSGTVELEIHTTFSEELELVNLDGETAEPLYASSHDLASGVVRAPLEHFSSYGARRRRHRPCETMACGSVCEPCPANRPNCQPPGVYVCSSPGRICVPVSQMYCPGLDGGVIPVNDGGFDPDAGPGPGADGGGFDGGAFPLDIEEVEVNDTPAQANVLPAFDAVGVNVHGHVTPATDVDTFAVHVPSSDYHYLEALTYADPVTGNCNNIDTFLTLLDAQGNVLATNDDAWSGTRCSALFEVLSPGATYYVQVTSYAGVTSFEYYLSMRMYPVGGSLDGGPGPGADGGVFPFPDAGTIPDAGGFPDGGGFFDAGGFPDGGGFFDGGSFFDAGGPTFDAGPDAGLTAGYFEVEVEPNDTRATAQSVPTGASVITFVDASINPSGDVDVYALQIPTGGPYTLQARTYAIAGPPSSCGGIDTTLAVFAGSGASLGSNDDYNGTSCSEVITAVPSGTVYVEVRAFVGTISQYHLELVVQ